MRTTQVRITREASKALRALAEKLEYILERGARAGEGDIGGMLEAVARGELEIIKSGQVKKE